MRSLKGIQRIECEDTMRRSAGSFGQDDQEMVARMQVQDLLPFALILVVVGIVIAFGLQVQGEVKDDMGVDSCAGRSDSFTDHYNATDNLCYNSTGSTSPPDTYDFNATSDAQDGVANLSDKLPTIGLIGGIVVVITLLVGGFMALRSR